MKLKIPKLILSTSMASGLEYYNFIIYGLLATYLSKALLSDNNNLANIIQIFGIFALGYFARPLGGVIFGSLGDRYGRRKVFLGSLFLMAVSTFSIGLLPTYESCGLISVYLLILMRVLQGLAFGAELPGTITFLSEHASPTNRGFYCGLALSSVSLGAALGSGVIYFFSQLLDSPQMQSYGWRLPFLLGGTLAIVSFFIRKKVIETPVFLQHLADIKIDKILSEKKIAINILLKNYLKRIVLGVDLCLFGACFIIFGVSMPTYLHHYYKYSSHMVYLHITGGLSVI